MNLTARTARVLFGLLATVVAVLVQTIPAAATPESPAVATEPPPAGHVVGPNGEKGYWLTLTTLPPLPGVEFVLGDVRVSTSPDGVAYMFRPDGVDQTLLAVSTPELNLAVGSRARLSSVRPSRLGAQALFDMYHEVAFDFDAHNGRTLDVQDLNTVRLKSSVGQAVELQPGERAWLQGSRVVPSGPQRIVKDIYWTVEEVDSFGTNVVNRSQQRFFPTSQRQVTIDLLFYSATLRASDALLGASVGDAVLLEYPDGTTVRHEFDNGQLTLPSLPRGTYHLTLLGPGLRLVRPLALTRDQEVELELFTWLDIGLVGGALLSVTLGLLAIGWRRRRHRTATRLPARSVSPAPTQPAGGAGGPTTGASVPEQLAVAFARVLRGGGLSVPIGCVLTFGEGLAEVGVADRDTVYWAARTTLIRRPEDLPFFERAFAVFWGPAGTLAKATAGGEAS